MQALYDVQARILSLQQESLKGISTPEIDQINASIIALLNEARATLSGNGTKTLLQIENDLVSLMRQRRYLYEEKTQATEELLRLYREKRKRRAQSWNGRRT